jgi:hypothetical protein
MSLFTNNNLNKPKKFGTKWTEDEREILLNSISKDNDIDENIIAISIKLERSEGGIRGEIRKMIVSRYFNGDDSETISDDMSISIIYVKMIIKNYLDKDAEADIIILKRENELLKLRLENAKLQNDLKNEINK